MQFAREEGKDLTFDLTSPAFRIPRFDWREAPTLIDIYTLQ